MFFVYTYSTHKSLLHVALQIGFHGTGCHELCGQMFQLKWDQKLPTFSLLQPWLSTGCRETPASLSGAPPSLSLTLLLVGCSSYFFHSSLCEMHFHSDTTILAARPWNGGTGAVLTSSSPLLAPYHISHTSDRASRLQRKKIYNCNDIEKSSSF